MPTNYDPYREKIELLFSELSSLNENSKAKTHSKKWNTIFLKMEELTKEIAETLWHYAAVEILTDPSDDEIFESVNYSETLYKIITHYQFNRKKDKDEINDPNSNFWKYYIVVLRNDVFKHKTEIKNQILNKKRVFLLSTRQQKKINKMTSLVIKYNKENPGEKKITINDEKAKEIFLANKICKDEKSLDRLLEANRKSIGLNNSNKEEILENTEDTKYNIETESLTLDETIRTINLFCNLMDKAFQDKINLKKQKDNDQILKETFLKDIITCYYMNKILKKFPNLEFKTVINLMKNRSFTSSKILSRYIQKDQEISDIINSKNPDLIKDLDKLEKSNPATLESISTEYRKKNINYGTRRISDFRKFFREQIKEMSSVEDVLQLI